MYLQLYILYNVSFPDDAVDAGTTTRRSRDESISDADDHVSHTVTIDVHEAGVAESTDL